MNPVYIIPIFFTIVISAIVISIHLYVKRKIKQHKKELDI